MKSDAIVGALKAAAGEGVDVDEALDQLGDLVEIAHAKPVKKDLSKVEVILSEVPLGFAGKTCVVGWDTCGACHGLVSACTCKGGPTEPPYVQKFRQEPVIPGTTVPTAVRSRTPKDVAEEVVDPANPQTQVIHKKICATCKFPRNESEMDRSDDGTYLCHKCQEASA